MSPLCYTFAVVKTAKKRKENFMKKIISKVSYDTENAEFISKKVCGFLGDESGFEECLFKTPEGKFFLYVNGGESSPYKKEDIKRISAEKAKIWLEEN